MIAVKNVHKSFDGHVVLNNISAEMHDGHCNMIIGQSGSGKTVLMKSIIGRPTLNTFMASSIQLSASKKVSGTFFQQQ